MGIYYIVIEYDSPKAVFETKRQAEEFVDDRPGREVEMAVSAKIVIEAMEADVESFSKQNAQTEEKS